MKTMSQSEKSITPKASGPLSGDRLSYKRFKGETTSNEQEISIDKQEINYNESNEKYLKEGISLYAIQFIKTITAKNSSIIFIKYSSWMFNTKFIWTINLHLQTASYE